MIFPRVTGRRTQEPAAGMSVHVEFCPACPHDCHRCHGQGCECACNT